MTALHPQPTLSALAKFGQPIWRHFRAIAQWNLAQAAIKYVAIASVSLPVLLQTTGCASVRLIDNDVTAFSTLASVPAGSTYRFERLPSQQAYPQQQDQLEGIAQAALAKVGLARVGDAPGSPVARYSVQMGINVQSVPSALWDDLGPRFGGFVGVGSGPFLLGTGPVRVVGHIAVGQAYGPWGYPLFYRPPPNYVRTVSLVLRDVASNQVVFETHAKNENPWTDSVAILPAMFDAALQGFPAPPAGPRRVNMEIPR
jgi:Domain of unknown function (DUF4136)